MNYIKVELKKVWTKVKSITKMIFTKKELKKLTKSTFKEWKVKVKVVTVRKEHLIGLKSTSKEDKSSSRKNWNKEINTYLKTKLDFWNKWWQRISLIMLWRKNSIKKDKDINEKFQQNEKKNYVFYLYFFLCRILFKSKIYEI